MPSPLMEQLTDSEMMALAKISDLRKTRFEEAAALVLKFNDQATSVKDKCYLKMVIGYILQAFDQQPIEHKRPFNVLMHLSQAHDEAIFRGVITHIAKVCSEKALVNHYALRGLAQILWENASKDELKGEISYKLASAEITALLELVNNKLENNIASLSEFSRLLDAIVDSKVVGIPELSIDTIKEKLDAWFKQTDNELLKYKLAYAKQALLRVGSDEPRVAVWKRRAYTFLGGIQDFDVAASFGVATPDIVLDSIDACKHLSVAFNSNDKEKWYQQFRDLQAALVQAFCKEKLYPKDHKEFKEVIDKLADKSIHSHTRLAVVDILVHIIAQHNNETLQDSCLEVLVSYYNDTKHNWLKKHVLMAFAELSRLKQADGNNNRIDAEVLNAQRAALTENVRGRSASDAYAEALSIARAREDFMEPNPLAVDIVLLGQLKANVDIDGDVIKPARKLFVSILEPGAYFDGEVVACSVTGIALNAKSDASKVEISNLTATANKVLDDFADVCVCVTSKDVSGKATLAFNQVTAVSVGAGPSKLQTETDAAKAVALAAMAVKHGAGKSETLLDKLNTPVATHVLPHKESNVLGLEACLIKNSQGDVVAVNNKIVGQMIQPTIGDFNKGGITYVKKLVTDKFGSLMLELTDTQLQEIISALVKTLQEQKGSTRKLPEICLSTFQAQLETYYLQTGFVNKRLFNEDYFLLADYFVNLQVVISTDKQQETTFSSNQVNAFHQPLREQDRLSGEKKAIELSTLFDASTYKDANGNQPNVIKTVLVSGAAGVGKTTLSDYIAYQWALYKQGKGQAGLWSAFDIVLIVRCRHLQPQAFNATWTDADLLRFACLGGLSVSVDDMQQIRQYMDKSPERGLLLFDGLDELPVFEPESVAERLLARLFSLPFKKIVTTRPYAITNLRIWLVHDGLVEVSGFKEEDIPEYFNRVLGNTEKTAAFVKGLKNNRNTWEMAHIPINAYLLKRWWTHSKNKCEVSALAGLSQSDLYEALMVDLFRVYISKKRKLKKAEIRSANKIVHSNDCKTVFTVLGQWAFEGLIRNTTDLALDWLDGVTPQEGDVSLLAQSVLDKIDIEALEQSGLIKQINKENDNSPQYCFLHLTFQEFLAASVIADYLTAGREEEKACIGNIIKAYKFHPNFTLVWPFVSGCLKKHLEVLDDFLEQLFIKAPQDWVGLTENVLLMQCMEASLSDAQLMPTQQRLLDAIMLFDSKLYYTQKQVVETLEQCPNILIRYADHAMEMLKNKAIDGWIRSSLAVACVAQLPSWPSPDDLCQQIIDLLEKETIDEWICSKLATTFVAQLPSWPSPDTLCHQLVGLLEKEAIAGKTRVELATIFVAQLPSWSSPEILCYQVVGLLENETIVEWARGKLATAFVAQLPSWPSPEALCHQVVSLLEKETINKWVHRNLAMAFVAQLPSWPSPETLCYQMIDLLENEAIDERVRGVLATAFVTQLPSWPLPKALCHQVFSLLEKETIDKWVRDELATAFMAQLSSWPSPEALCHRVVGLLEKKTINEWSRCHLAEVFVAQLPSWPSPELCHQVVGLLEKETIEAWIRSDLAAAFIAQLPSWPSPEALCHQVIGLLENETINEWVRGDLAKAFVAQLPSWPSPEVLCHQVIGLLENKAIDGKVRSESAKAFVAHLPSWPSPEVLCHQVIDLLENKAIPGKVRGELAKACVAQLPSWPSPKVLCHQVLSLLENETISEWIRRELATAFVDQFLLWPSPDTLCHQIVGLLENEMINGDVRGELAKACVAQLPLWPSPKTLCYQVIDLLGNETIKKWVRRELATAFVAQLPSWPSPEALCHQVVGLLENKAIHVGVRDKLATAFVAQLSSWLSPEALYHQVVGLLENEAIDKWIRSELVEAYVAQLPKLSNERINRVVRSILAEDRMGDCLFSTCFLKIPIYLVLDKYEEMGKKSQSRVRELLLGNYVLLVAHNGKVKVRESGKEKLVDVPLPAFSLIKQDMSKYRLLSDYYNIRNSPSSPINSH